MVFNYLLSFSFITLYERNDYVMNIKKIVSSMLTATVLVTTIVMPSYAEDSFSTAKEFLSDVLDVSTAEVESQTLTTAKETIMNSINISGDEVFYDGVSIGYWYSDEPSKLYADAGKTSTVIAPDTGGYTISPSLLYDMLYDLNELLEDNYVPSTADWSKIIGKYDVTLGDVTIPANQWIPLEPDGDPLKNNKVVDISSLTGTSVYQPTYCDGNEHQIIISAYAIDKNGKLYISNGASSHQYDDGRGWIWARGYWLLDSSPNMAVMRVNVNAGNNSVQIESGVNKIKAGISIETENRLYLQYYTTDLTNANAYHVIPGSDARSDFSTLYDISNASIKNTTPISDMVQTGIFYFTCRQAGVSSDSNIKYTRTKFFDKQSSSRKTIGNQVLRRRLGALNSLLPTDTVTLTADGWTVNGLQSIDTYISDQSLSNAGDTADIPAVADIDALQFNVILPTSLPVYVDASNVTYVADNADVVNKSGAAVKITDVEIVPKQDSGWTMVDGTPSRELEGHEFNFATTIEKDKVLAVSEVYPFQYSAKLSPTAEASNSLELASVLVTVDWAST